jgi:NAD(P)-dependent dehydrogenase (short-subunit alcohol dehydrogenase family)
MLLNGKRTVFIGGSSGMGLAAAQLAVQEGATVVIAARSREKLARAKQDLGGGVAALPLDATDEGAVKAFFQQVGPFDHLLTTITSGERQAFLNLDVAAAKTHFEGKFWGQWLAARYGAPHLRAGGSITFFSGIWGHRPPGEVAVIAAMNSGIEGLARALAVELAPIRVNAVSPGLIDTPIYAGMPPEVKDAMFSAYGAATPVKRVGRPEEVARTVLYLMTNSFTTGSTIFVDGGYTLR